MRAKKDDQGFMSTEQLNHRFINVLQLVYLSANQDRNGNYLIDDSVMSKIEAELDFNTNEKTKSKIIEESKKKYRKRKTYLLWDKILSEGSYQDYEQARNVLMAVHESNKYIHNSMTHERYALETMQLALDDYFGTNKLKITPSRFLQRNLKNKRKKQKRGKCIQKKKSIQRSVTMKKFNSSDLVF